MRLTQYDIGAIFTLLMCAFVSWMGMVFTWPAFLMYALIFAVVALIANAISGRGL